MSSPSIDPRVADEAETLARRLDDLLRYALHGVWDVATGWPVEPGKPALAFTRTFARLVELGAEVLPVLEDAFGRLGWSAIPAVLRHAMLGAAEREHVAREWREPARPVLHALARSEHAIRWHLERLHFLRDDEGLETSPRALLLSAPFRQLARTSAPTPLACLLALEPSLPPDRRRTVAWYLRQCYAQALEARGVASGSDDVVLAALTGILGESAVDQECLEPWVVDHWIALGVFRADRVVPGQPELRPPPERLRGSRELSLLDLASQSGGRWDTAQMLARLDRVDGSFVPGTEQTLVALGRLGLVVQIPQRDAPDGWVLALEGHEVLADCLRHSWPLSPGEVTAYVRRLEADQRDDEPPPGARWASAVDRARALQQASALLPGSAAVGRAVWRLVGDRDPDVRLAFFQGFAPPPSPDTGSDDWDVHGQGAVTLPVYAWDALLRTGLRDADARVREAAAALAFATGRGAALTGELLGQLAAREPELRRWSARALGSAADPESRAALERLLPSGDLEDSAAAVRALAARPDGHGAWRAALDDPRPAVRQAARLALEQVVEGLPDDELDRMAARGGPMRVAAKAYRARVARRAESASRPIRRSVWQDILRV